MEDRHALFSTGVAATQEAHITLRQKLHLNPVLELCTFSVSYISRL